MIGSARPAVVGLLVVATALVGCGAHDLHTTYPGAPPATMATLELRFTRAVKHLSVTVNGVLVAEDAHTARLVVDRIPAGRASVMLAADGAPERVFTVDLEASRRAIVPLAAAPAGASMVTSLLQSVLAATVYVTYVSIRAAL